MSIEKFNAVYAQFLAGLSNAVNLALALVRTLAVTIGIPFSLIFIMVVEQDRVRHGLLVISDENDTLASFAAWVVVILNVVFELMIVHQEKENGYRPSPSKRWSFRVVINNIRYAIWAPTLIDNPVSQRYRRALGFLTFSILFLALLGSMGGAMEKAEGPWYSALVNIIAESTLVEFVSWMGGLMFAFTLVSSAQTLSNYIGENTSNTLDKIEQQAKVVRTMEAAKKERKNGRDPRISPMPNGKFVATCPRCKDYFEHGSYDQALAYLDEHRCPDEIPLPVQLETYSNGRS